MIKVVNHLYQNSEIDSFIKHYKYLVFETDCIDNVKKIILARFFKHNNSLKNELNKFIYIQNYLLCKNDIKDILFISKYQILWDITYLKASTSLISLSSR